MMGFCKGLNQLHNYTKMGENAVVFFFTFFLDPVGSLCGTLAVVVFLDPIGMLV